MHRLTGWKAAVITKVYEKSCWLPSPSSGADWTTFLSNVGNISHKQNTNRKWQPPALFIPYLPPYHSLFVRDMHRKSARSTTVYCMSKISLWNPGGIFTSCRSLDFTTGPRVMKKCLVCSLIRTWRGPKCFKTASGPGLSQTLIFSYGRHLLVYVALPLLLCSPIVLGFLSRLHGPCWQVLMDCLN